MKTFSIALVSSLWSLSQFRKGRPRHKSAISSGPQASDRTQELSQLSSPPGSKLAVNGLWDTPIACPTELFVAESELLIFFFHSPLLR